MSTISYDKFIGVYTDFFSEKFCDELIAHYEWCRLNNKTYVRGDSEIYKKDEAHNLNPLNFDEIAFTYDNASGYIAEFNNIFWNVCYKDYRKQYSVMDTYRAHTIYTYKVQKTEPAGGYHLWHFENESPEYSRRIGVYILYLNDVEEGGETEFLYLSKRIKPKKGTLVIFPPNYPWAHRGNPPLSGSKYIMTGWMEFS